MNNPETLESLLEKGIITQEEFDHLERQRNPANLSLFRKIFSFILSIIAIIVVLFGTCIINIGMAKDWETDSIFILTIVWVLFPAVLFGWIANKTKNVGVKWAVRFLILIIPIELVIVLLSF